MRAHVRKRLCCTYQLLKPVPWELSASCGAGPTSGVAGAAWNVAAVSRGASPFTSVRTRTHATGRERASLCPGFLRK